MLILFREEQFLKQQEGSFKFNERKETVDKEVQFSKQDDSIVFTFLGIIIEEREEQD
jgi:hypothetical protein